MPQISQRSIDVPLSPFRKLIPLADAAKAKGKKIYHLNIGQPDILTPAAAIEQFQALPLELIEYSPAQGYLSYRQALVDYYKRFDVQLGADDISITTGGSEAIQLFLLSCLDPGDEVISAEPFYANYNGFAHIAGVKVKAVSCSIEDGFALPAKADFEAAISDKTKAILITNPNNPTGATYSQESLEMLADLAKKHDLFLCVDEVYREFCYNDTPFYSALNLAAIADHVVVVDSVSKRYSACGLRIGALVTHNKAITEAVGRYAKLRLSPPGLGQRLAALLLEDDTAYLDEVKAAYRARRDLVYKRLSEMDGVLSYLPEGAFYCFARLPINSAEDFCRWLLTDFEHEGATVMLSPGQGFYATPNKGRNEVRIAYVLNEADLDKAMDCLALALKAYRAER